MEEAYKEKVLNFLKKNKEHITPRQLAKKAEMSYPTVLKCVDILFAEGRIEVKDFGSMKLVKLKKK